MRQKILLKTMLLLCALIVGSGSAWADTSTLTFTTACGGSGTADDGVEWTVTSDGTESNFDNTKGIHYGTSSAQVQYIKLSTSGISGTVTKVVVNASTASGVTATVSVTIGDNAYGGNAQSLTTSAANYTFEGSASGDILVEVTKPSKAAKAIYVKSIAVTYSTGSPSDPSITASDVNIAYSATSGSITYTLNNATGNVTANVTNGDWLTLGTITASEVPFTCSANTGAARTAEVTLSYEGATDKVVTVTQAAAPSITTGSNSLTGFTYVEGNGPSAAKTISVSGSNLVAYIALSLGDNSNYEMSETENGTYTNSLTLSPTNGTVSATNIYVRLRSGLEAGDKNGAITLTSTDASNATVTLSGSVTTLAVTYDANGADTGTVPTDATGYAYNSSVTVLGNIGEPALAKTGYAFGGWCMNSEGTEPVYGPNNTTTFAITANTTLYAKWNPYSITAQSNNNSYGTVQLNGFVITASPVEGYTYASPAYTVSSGTATVEQNGNEFTVTPTSDCTVTINFEAITTHTATFSVNGETYSSSTFYEGQAIQFPSDPAAISGKSFVGWLKNSTIPGTTNDAPSIVNKSTETMGNANITYYAVFADVTPGSATSTTKTITTNTTNIPTSYGDANTFSEYTLEGIKFMVQQMYLNNNKLQWRADGHANGTGTMYNKDELSNLQSVVLTYDGDNNKNFTLKIGDTENPTSGTSITPTVSQENANVYTYDCSSYNKSYFVLANGSNAGYLASIAITYLAGTPDTYSNYCTTVAELAANVITGINDSYTLDFALTNESLLNLDLSGATATSGATVQFEVTNNTMDGHYDLTDGVLTVGSNGTMTIRAYVNRDATYNAAEKIVTVTVVDDPVIGYANETETTAYGTPYTIDEDLIDGGTVTIQSGNTNIATVSGLVITPVAVGSVTITINTEATDIWHAGSATFTLNITAPEGSATAANSYVFNETFDGFVTNSSNATTQGGNDNGQETGNDIWYGNAGASAFQAINCDESGWTVTKGGAGYQCAKFGSSSEAGSAITRSITVENGKTYNLTFKAAPWNEETTRMSVTATGATVSGLSTDAMTRFQWNDYTATVTATAESITLTFSADKNRFFLDEVKLSTNTTISVTLNGSGYATYCSQYPLDFSNASGYSAWQITDVNSTTEEITFSQITGKIKGGTGILLKGPATNPRTTITLTSADSDTVLDDNLLVGTMAPTYVAANQYYGLSGDTFVKVNPGTVPVGKALLPASVVDGAGARLTFVFEDASGIANINVNDNDNRYYDLQGRRVAAPQKGLYIVNGKKVVMK